MISHSTHDHLVVVVVGGWGTLLAGAQTGPADIAAIGDGDSWSSTVGL